MNVLVTGVAGFIGSHIADKLIANGHTVYGCDDLSGGVQENIPKNVTLHISNSDTDPQVAWYSGGEDLKITGCDVIIHCGAYAAEILSPHIRLFNYRNNLLASVNLINLAVKHKVKLFVFLSSIAVYGHGQAPFSEDTPLAPQDPYGIAKMAVELDLKSAHAQFGLPYVIFRPYNVYGPRQNIGDPYRNVVGIFMNACLKGEPMRIFGDGTQRRAFSHIDDVAPTIADAIDSPQHWNQTYNIGGAATCDVRNLALMVAQAMGQEMPNIRFMPARHEVHTAYCDNRRADKLRPMSKPYTDLQTGLAKMAAWVKQHGARTGQRFRNIEIEEGLPEIWRNL